MIGHYSGGEKSQMSELAGLKMKKDSIFRKEKKYQSV